MLSVKQTPQKAVFSFEVDLNFETSRRLEEKLFSVDISSSNLEVDFSKVHFIDSTGVSLLIKWLYPSKDKYKVTITGASEQVKNVLAICKIDQFIQVQ